MGSSEKEENNTEVTRHSKSHISQHITLAAVSSFFGVTLLLITLFLCVKYHQNRRRRRFFPDSESRHVEATADGLRLGLDAAALAALPVFAQKPGAGSRGGDGECSVCLGAVVEGASVRLLPNCGHAFHAECVDAWLAEHATCPLCRAQARPPPLEPTAPPVDEIGLLHSDAAQSPSDRP